MLHVVHCCVVTGAIYAVCLQETMAKMAKQAGSSSASVAKLNNVLMQMRKNCNHPDLITSGFDGSVFFPTPEQMASDCGKMRLVDRLLTALHGRGHKVLIFSQVGAAIRCLHRDLPQSHINRLTRPVAILRR